MNKNSRLFSSLNLKTKEILKSYVFLIPLILGLITFFIIPVVKSFLFSVSEVSTSGSGYEIIIKGFSAYNEALNVHTSYRQTVVSAIIDVVTTTPLIILFSFFMASILNQDFRGKTFFRVVLFLPLVLTVMNGATNTLENAMGAFSSFKGEGEGAVSFTSEISQFLLSAGIAEEPVKQLVNLVDKIYGIIDASAIQILIILVAMQTVSPSLYEAATVEGATSWESFWKITFPMVCPMIFTCVIYTIIDSFTGVSNKVMTLMTETAFTKLQFSLASAMGWIYFFMVALVIAVVSWLFSKLLKHYQSY